MKLNQKGREDEGKIVLGDGEEIKFSIKIEIINKLGVFNK